MAEHQVEACSCSLNSYKCDFVSQLDIGLAARHLLGMLGIDEPNLDVAFQDVVNRNPVGWAAGEVPEWDLFRRPSPKWSRPPARYRAHGPFPSAPPQTQHATYHRTALSSGHSPPTRVTDTFLWAIRISRTYSVYLS